MGHLKMLPPVQCEACMRTQLWEGEGEPGRYVFYFIEDHDEECPHIDRKGTKVLHSELKP